MAHAHGRVPPFSSSTVIRQSHNHFTRNSKLTRQNAIHGKVNLKRTPPRTSISNQFSCLTDAKPPPCTAASMLPWVGAILEGAR
ncbi:hypothetical protein WAI453_013381 [Rhynchosporium graminicola]